MASAIGLLELKSIPVGLETADTVLKSAEVKLLQASPACPGKYVMIFSGDVGAVKSAMAAGTAKAGPYLITSHLISHVHDAVPAAITGTAEIESIGALGMIETISALTAIEAGDVAAKAADVKLVEIRVARGLGGKGYLLLTGDIAAVKAAVNEVLSALADSGEITSSCTIPNPHPDMINYLQ